MNPVSRLAANLKQRVMLMKATSFALVGVVNTVIDLGVFLLARNLFELSLVAANILSWLVAVSFSYTLNSFTTFAAESGRQLRWRSYATFVASGVVGVTASTTTLVLLSYVIPELLAKLAAIGVSFLVNFSFSHFVVFRQKKANVIVREGGRSSNPGDPLIR